MLYSLRTHSNLPTTSNQFSLSNPMLIWDRLFLFIVSLNLHLNHMLVYFFFGFLFHWNWYIKHTSYFVPCPLCPTVCRKKKKSRKTTNKSLMPNIRCDYMAMEQTIPIYVSIDERNHLAELIFQPEHGTFGFETRKRNKKESKTEQSPLA